MRPFEPERFVDPEVRSAFLERLERDGAVTDYLLRLRRADDTPFWAEVSAHLEQGAEGSGGRLAALMRDVSERRRLEDQSRDLYHELLQTEKLATLGQTVSGVAARAQQPRSRPSSPGRERLAARPLDDVTKRGVETILSESERAAKIVRNLLTFSRKRHTTPRDDRPSTRSVRETLALRSYEQRVSEHHDHRCPGLRVTARVRGSSSRQTGPAQPHHQRGAGDAGGAWSWGRSSHGPGTTSTRNRWCWRSTTTVPGFRMRCKPRSSTPFFTTKAVGEGHRPGAHRGLRDHPRPRRDTSRVKSEPGPWSVVLRRATGQYESCASPSSRARRAQPSSDGAVAMVLRGSRMSQRSPRRCREALTDAGFRVDRAGDGQEALERIRERVYDLVVCDLKDAPHGRARVVQSD